MKNYEEIKIKYGHVSSWAIWQKRDSTKKEKFGMGDVSFFNNIDTKKLNPNIILVGLNISHKIKKPLRWFQVLRSLKSVFFHFFN